MPVWHLAKELDKFNTQSQLFRNKSQLQLAITSSSSQESIKHIFDVREKKKYINNSQSIVTRAHSQATTLSSATWSKSDIPTSSKLSSKVILHYIYYQKY